MQPINFPQNLSLYALSEMLSANALTINGPHNKFKPFLNNLFEKRGPAVTAALDKGIGGGGEPGGVYMFRCAPHWGAHFLE